MSLKSKGAGASLPRAERRLLRSAATLLLALPLLAVSPPAQAVNVKSLVGDLCQYHLLDSDVCSAHALIDCLVKTGGNVEGLQQCAADYDPRAQKFIDVYSAATQPDYVRLIELAGPIIACKLLPPGPPTDILCSTAIRPIVSEAFGKAARIYGAAEKGDWLTVIYLVGDPSLACTVVPSFPGKEIPCGAIAQLLVEGGKLLKAGVEAGIKALETGVGALGSVASAGLQSVGLGKAGVAPENTFYQYHARPLLHQRALKALVSKSAPAGGPWLGFDDAMMKNCRSSVDPTWSQPQLAATKCSMKSKQLHSEATALADMVRVAPPAYFANAQASASLLLATNFWSGNSEKFVSQMRQLPRTQWSEAGFQSLPSPYSAVLGSCYANTRERFPVPVSPQAEALPGAPPNLWGWVCGVTGISFSYVLAAEKERLTKQVIPQLAGAGCVLAKTGDDTLRFDCSNGAALRLCHALLPDANPNSRCRKGPDFKSAFLTASVSRGPAGGAQVQAGAVVAPAAGTPPPKRLSAAAAASLALQPASVEAEALVRSDAARVSAGRADAQPMRGFGAGWSGGEQLFWSGGGPGATLELTFGVPAAGRYALEMNLTRAPDYGQLRLELDGQPGGADFDGFDPGVVPSGAISLGTFGLPAGPQRIRVTIVGRNPRSGGFFAGIDNIRLVPATEGN